jgi:hypothetical protein
MLGSRQSRFPQRIAKIDLPEVLLRVVLEAAVFGAVGLFVQRPSPVMIVLRHFLFVGIGAEATDLELVVPTVSFGGLFTLGTFVGRRGWGRGGREAHGRGPFGAGAKRVCHHYERDRLG